jgi:hypothetical protein
VCGVLCVWCVVLFVCVLCVCVLCVLCVVCVVCCVCELRVLSCCVLSCCVELCVSVGCECWLLGGISPLPLPFILKMLAIRSTNFR